MDEHTEKIIAERVVYKGKVLSVLERDIEIAPGKTVTWEVTATKGTKSVEVLAIDDGGNVLMVEEYLGGINARGLVFPGGTIDDGEDPVITADRELQEEIGYRGDLTKLAELAVRPGYSTQHTILFLAQHLRPSKLVGDEDHHFELRRIPFAKALAMCETGEINDARVVAGLLLAAKKLQ